MKRKLISTAILASFSILLVTSCDSEEDSDPTLVTTSIDISDPTFSGKNYEYQFSFRDGLINANAKEFNPEIADFCFGASLANYGNKKVLNYYKDLGFENIKLVNKKSEDYETVQFAFAHKKIDSYDLVTVSINGLNYGNEWIGNFQVGLTGGHENFSLSAQNVKENLEKYINDNNYSNLKIMLAGFSRGAAVSNYLSHLIISSEDKIVDDNNFYVYTFEAPKSIYVDDAKEYENVFNIINSADLVVNVTPDSYGLRRCGKDIDIYDPSIDSLLLNVDNEINIPKLAILSHVIETDYDIQDYLLELLTKYNPNPKSQTYDVDKNYALNTREAFYYNYSNAFGFMCKIVFDLNNQAKDALVDDFSQKAQEIEEIYSLFSDAKSLHDYLKQFIDMDKGFIYSDEEDLMPMCDKIVGFIDRNFTSFIPLFTGDRINNIKRIALLHGQLTNYLLFKNYIKLT